MFPQPLQLRAIAKLGSSATALARRATRSLVLRVRTSTLVPTTQEPEDHLCRAVSLVRRTVGLQPALAQHPPPSQTLSSAQKCWLQRRMQGERKGLARSQSSTA